MFWFIEEDGVGGSCPREKTRSHYPNNSPVPTSSDHCSSPAADFQQHNPTRLAVFSAEVKPQHRKWNVWR
jgi:hypothetical protein